MKKLKEKGMSTTGLIAIVAVLGLAGFLLFSQMDNNKQATNSVSQSESSDMMDDSDSDTKANMMDGEAGVMVGGAMMVPNLDIVENAQNADNVTTVVAAVSAAGLVDTLKSSGPFTVFAPNNDAFSALPAGTVDTLLLPENKDDLVNILTYHVVPGRHTSADLFDGQELTTVQGQTILIGESNGVWTVNGTAMVETADVISSNGVTFVIDAVLLPPTE